MRSSAILLPLLAACGLAAPTDKDEIVARDVTIDPNTGMPIDNDQAQQNPVINQGVPGSVFQPNGQNPNVNNQFPNQFPNNQFMFNGVPTIVCGQLNSLNRRSYNVNYLRQVVNRVCRIPAGSANGPKYFINNQVTSTGQLGINFQNFGFGNGVTMMEFPLYNNQNNWMNNGNMNNGQRFGWQSGDTFTPNQWNLQTGNVNRQGTMVNGVFNPVNNQGINFGQNQNGMLPNFSNGIGPDMVVFDNNCNLIGAMTLHASFNWNIQGNVLDGCQVFNWD